MYGYINVNEIEDLAWKKRQGIVISNIITEDINEYINNTLANLRNSGFDLNLINQPRIMGDKNHGYSLVLLIKKSKLIDMQSSMAWTKLLTTTDSNENKMTLQGFVTDKHFQKKENNTAKDAISNGTKINCIFKNIDTDKNVNGSIQLAMSGKHIVKAIVKINNNNQDTYIEDVTSCLDDISRIIAKSVGKAFREYRLHLQYVRLKVNNRVQEYKVEPTESLIKLIKQN